MAKTIFYVRKFLHRVMLRLPLFAGHHTEESLCWVQRHQPCGKAVTDASNTVLRYVTKRVCASA